MGAGMGERASEQASARPHPRARARAKEALQQRRTGIGEMTPSYVCVLLLLLVFFLGWGGARPSASDDGIGVRYRTHG